MKKTWIVFSCLIVFVGALQAQLKKPNFVKYSWEYELGAQCLINRHTVPKGFHLVPVTKNSFAEWLQFLPLKPKDEPIKLYDGKRKFWQAQNAGVIDIDIGTRDLQQCADAVMRLRAEYLYSIGKYDKIHFNYTSGFKAEYSKWREGFKIGVKGNNVFYYKKPSVSDKAYAGFKKYLTQVYSYAGTFSLDKELVTQPLSKIKAGDVLIIGGFPGHVVMVVAVAQNEAGEKAVLLAQSYMPAQNIHLVKKAFASGDKVWFKVSDLKDKGWHTTEFHYEAKHLKTWAN